MPKRKTDIIIPGPGEDVIINAQIAAGPDTFEADEEWPKNARSTADLFPELLRQYQQKKADLEAEIIEEVQITLDAEITKWFRAQTGKDGKTRGASWKSPRRLQSNTSIQTVSPDLAEGRATPIRRW